MQTIIKRCEYTEDNKRLFIRLVTPECREIKIFINMKEGTAYGMEREMAISLTESFDIKPIGMLVKDKDNNIED